MRLVVQKKESYLTEKERTLSELKNCMIPIVRKIHEINVHFFKSFAQSLFIYPQINAANDEEKIIEEPT